MFEGYHSFRINYKKSKSHGICFGILSKKKYEVCSEFNLNCWEKISRLDSFMSVGLYHSSRKEKSIILNNSKGFCQRKEVGMNWNYLGNVDELGIDVNIEKQRIRFVVNNSESNWMKFHVDMWRNLKENPLIFGVSFFGFKQKIQISRYERKYCQKRNYFQSIVDNLYEQIF